MAHRSMLAATPLLVGSLLLGGCTLGGADEPEDGATGAAPAADASGGTQAGQVGETVDVLLAAAGQESVDLSGELPVLGTRAAGTAQGEYEVDLNGVAVRGELMTVVFTLRVLSVGSSVFAVNGIFDDGTSRDDNAIGVSRYSTDGVYVLDPAAGTRHLVAYDSEGRCVCTVDLSGNGMDAGNSVTLSSTFAAPPEGTTTVDVVIPTVGAFTGVTLER